MMSNGLLLSRIYICHMNKLITRAGIPRQPAGMDRFALPDYEQLVERAGALAALLRPVLAQRRHTR
ncbi:hypothetical protein A6A27_18615 [Micromonospora sp. CB01531]|nr:hypothetical protein A6A27_18615 [Micromonospora sp. CB01531]